MSPIEGIDRVRLDGSKRDECVCVCVCVCSSRICMYVCM